MELTRKQVYAYCANMRLFFSAIALFMSCQLAFGQLDSLKFLSPIDSATIRFNSVQAKVSARLDSLTKPIKSSLKTNLLTDSLASVSGKLDSIQTSLNARVDSLTTSYTSMLTSIQASAERYQSKMDSLQTLKLPTDKYQAKMDSLAQKLTKTQQELSSKIEGLKNKASEKIKSIPFPPALEDKVNKLTNSVEGLGPNTIETKLPASLNFEKLKSSVAPISLGKVPQVPGVNVPGLPKVNGLNQQNIIPNIKPGATPDINGLQGVSNVTGQAKSIQGKIDEAAKEYNPNNIDKLADAKASQLNELKALQEKPTELPVNVPKSEEEMKTMVKEQAQKLAVDHFASKQEQLKSAMAKISKYKTKYPSVSSITEITKRPPNGMRNKPFVERIIPGIGMQIHTKGEDFLVDFNPYLGYRFTGRITAGPGWNQRVAYNFDNMFFNQEARIYGPRLFGEFKLGKGFSPRVEVEVMNTKVPPSTVTPGVDPGARQWVWGAFVGMKKEYKLINRIKGTASVMTRLFNADNKSPYADILNVRFGFEFPMKKSHKRKSR